MSTLIATSKAPSAIGAYSQARRVGPTLYVSGQLGLDPGSMQFVGTGAKEQAQQAMQNLQAIVEAAGLTMQHVVKTTVLLADIADFAEVNQVYAKFFTQPYPARAAYQVAGLPKNGRVEIEAICHADICQ